MKENCRQREAVSDRAAISIALRMRIKYWLAKSSHWEEQSSLDTGNASLGDEPRAIEKIEKNMFCHNEYNKRKR